MGKKRTAGQQTNQSMASLVQRAALVQMGPQIEQTVRAYVQQLGNQLAQQQASTLETIFARVVVLETIIMEKLGYTTDDLTEKVATIEDEKENLTKSDTAEVGDVVRLEIRTKTNDQPVYQGSSRLKVYQTGTGQTLGQELENAVIGMKTKEKKEVKFGKDGLMTAEITIDRISRPEKQTAPQGETNDNQAEG